MELSVEIKSKRLQLGLTQKEFADALGMGKFGDRTLRRWENGETRPSSLEYNQIMTFTNRIPFLDNSKKECRFRFIDLFAGIGGIRIPFQELGGKCVFSSEWDTFAKKTYFANYGDQPQGDITKIDSVSIPEFDVLLAGFPCQPFSQAGLRKGFADTRGTLFFEIERIIREKRPKAFLLENVKQLIGHDHGHTISVIMSHLSALDYHVDYKVLRAADYGVPQNRERVYIVGFDTRYYFVPENYSFPYPVPTYTKTRLGDILDDNVNDKYTISDVLYAGHLRRKKEHKIKGNGFGFSLFTPESPYTNTLSARYYKDGSEILIDQGNNKNPRKLTPRECARLQGFPEDFIIPVSDTQAYKQFGNSVAVPVVRAVAKCILSEMDNLPVRGDYMADSLSSEKRSWNMSKIRSKDTSIEVKVRKYLFNKGFRYRKNVSSLPGKPDLVLSKYGTVIFVNGCFWHRHEGCKAATMPKTNVDFWKNKFEQNVENDKKNIEALEVAGWNVIVIWECEVNRQFEKTMERTINELIKQI